MFCSSTGPSISPFMIQAPKNGGWFKGILLYKGAYIHF